MPGACSSLSVWYGGYGLAAMLLLRQYCACVLDALGCISLGPFWRAAVRLVCMLYHTRFAS
jgi:hypothetical protein